MHNTTIASSINHSRPKGTPWRNLGTYSNVMHASTLHDILLTAGEMNFVDKSAYPELPAMEQFTVRFLLKNMHAPDGSGFATTGSSEAIILALAWHQRNFQDRRPKVKRPNFVVNRGHHKVFEKYAVLFGAELRSVPLGKDLRIDVAMTEDLVDDETFCIVGVAGSTELGMVDDIAGLNDIAVKRNVPMHIDAAIGGYVLPFVKNALVWDFQLPSVQTINVSAHKYGLCLPGIGFLLVRNNNVAPQQYNGDIAYLSGGGIVDHALSCSRNAAFVVNAYHNAQTLSKKGYELITQHNQRNKTYFANQLQLIPQITDVIRGDMPVVVFSGKHLHALSTHLTYKGWVQSPHHITTLKDEYIRIVMRKHITRGTLKRLLEDIKEFYAHTGTSEHDSQAIVDSTALIA